MNVLGLCGRLCVLPERLWDEVCPLKDDDGSYTDLSRARKRSAGLVKISRETVLQLLVKKGGTECKRSAV